MLLIGKHFQHPSLKTGQYPVWSRWIIYVFHWKSYTSTRTVTHTVGRCRTRRGSSGNGTVERVTRQTRQWRHCDYQCPMIKINSPSTTRVAEEERVVDYCVHENFSICVEKGRERQSQLPLQYLATMRERYLLGYMSYFYTVIGLAFAKLPGSVFGKGICVVWSISFSLSANLSFQWNVYESHTSARL